MNTWPGQRKDNSVLWEWGVESSDPMIPPGKLLGKKGQPNHGHYVVKAKR